MYLCFDSPAAKMSFKKGLCERKVLINVFNWKSITTHWSGTRFAFLSCSVAWKERKLDAE